MNKETLKVVLLSAALAGTMVSCQKDGEMISSQELSQKSLAQETSIIYYTINGKEYSKKFFSTEELNEHISYLIRLTTKGYIIVIRKEDPRMAPSEKDRQEIETKDKAEIDAWALDMALKGYKVTFIFNEENGTYIGSATFGESRGYTLISTERDSDSM